MLPDNAMHSEILNWNFSWYEWWHLSNNVEDDKEEEEVVEAAHEADIGYHTPAQNNKDKNYTVSVR